jgi:8-oxoguanine deaminase
MSQSSMIIKNCYYLWQGSPALSTGADGSADGDRKSPAGPGRPGALRGVDILIEGQRISAVGKNLEVPPGAEVIDAGDCVVMPGLVNTHHHFYQTLTRNLPAVQNAKLFTWLVYLYDVWKYLDRDAIYWSTALATAELLKTGCTLTTDHHYLYPRSVDDDIMALQFQAAEATGIRFSPTRGSMSRSKKDGGLPPDSVVQTEDEIMEDSIRVIRDFHDPSDVSMRKVVLAPCSPFSVSEELMSASAALAREHGVLLHTHLAETEDENTYCLREYGVRPLEMMARDDFLGPDVWFAHGIHFTDEEMRVLQETGTKITHCPTSNMRLGSGICRVPEMRDMGIPVALGVDGSASNDSSDMLGELRNALMLQRVTKGASALTLEDVLDMGSIQGASLLGYNSIGRIEPGWAADIAMFSIERMEYTGALSDPLAAIVFSGYNHEAKHTVVNGVQVVKNGRLCGPGAAPGGSSGPVGAMLVDEDEIRHKAGEAAMRMYTKAGVL